MSPRDSSKLEVCWRGRNYRQRVAIRQLHLMFKDLIGTGQLHESQKEVRDLNEKCPKVLRSATYLVASTSISFIIIGKARTYIAYIGMRQLHLTFKDLIGNEQLHESQKEARY